MWAAVRLQDDGYPVLTKVKFCTNGNGVDPWFYDQRPFGLLKFDQSEGRLELSTKWESPKNFRDCLETGPLCACGKPRHGLSSGTSKLLL
jgi:hypothetical protein